MQETIFNIQLIVPPDTFYSHLPPLHNFQVRNHPHSNQSDHLQNGNAQRYAHKDLCQYRHYYLYAIPTTCTPPPIAAAC